MRFRFKSLAIALTVIFSIFALTFQTARVLADPYGQGTYGTGVYNCNTDFNPDNGTCEEGGLANTGTDLLLIGGGAVILIGVALFTIRAKRKSKNTSEKTKTDQ